MRMKQKTKKKKIFSDNDPNLIYRIHNIFETGEYNFISNYKTFQILLILLVPKPLLIYIV